MLQKNYTYVQKLGLGGGKIDPTAGGGCKCVVLLQKLTRVFVPSLTMVYLELMLNGSSKQPHTLTILPVIFDVNLQSSFPECP